MVLALRTHLGDTCTGTYMMQYLNDFTFFGIVDPKVAVGGSSIAHEKCQSSYFKEKTSNYHWHALFKSNMALE